MSSIDAQACSELRRHEAKSKGRFSVIVWGTDSFASYGYPAVDTVEAINNVVVPTGPK